MQTNLPPVQRFLNGCENGDVEVVIEQMKANELKSFDKRFLEAGLWSASRIGCLPIVEFLVKMGVKVDSQVEKNGYSCFYVSCLFNHLEVAKFLYYEAKANPNALSKQGYTPLFAAAQSGHERIVEFLIGLGVSPDSTISANNLTPIYVSISANQLEIARYLLKNGANPIYGLHSAAFSNNVVALKMLISEFNVAPDSIVYNQRTSLYIACEQNNLECVKYLISQGANPNLRCISMTPFEVAEFNQSFRIVDFLLDYGTKMDFLKKLISRTRICCLMNNGNNEQNEDSFIHKRMLILRIILFESLKSQLTPPQFQNFFNCLISRSTLSKFLYIPQVVSASF